MKLKHIGLISPLILLTCLSLAKPIIVNDQFNYVVIDSSPIGPYYGTEGKKSLNYTYQYIGLTKKNTVYEMFTLKDQNGMTVDSNRSATHTLINEQIVPLTYTFDTSLFLKNICLTFSIKIYEKMNIVKDISLTIYRMGTRKAFDLEETKTLSSNPIIADFMEEATYVEDFEFYRMQPFFGNDTYYDLRLDNQQFFYYFKDNRFSAKKYSLTFEDENNLFPYIPFVDIGIKEIPIKLRSIDIERGIYGFSFPSSMYVEESTLNMSLTKQIGFKSTNRFFLPLKKQKQMEKMKFTLEIHEAGVEKHSFYYELTYYSSRLFFGECGESEYCIEGEIT